MHCGSGGGGGGVQYVLSYFLRHVGLDIRTTNALSSSYLLVHRALVRGIFFFFCHGIELKLLSLGIMVCEVVRYIGLVKAK